MRDVNFCNLLRIRLCDENLTEVLACRIVVDCHTIGAPNLKGSTHPEDIKRTLTCNGNLEVQGCRISTKLAGLYRYTLCTRSKFLRDSLGVNQFFSIVELYLCTFCFSIEVEVNNNFVAYDLSIEVVCKCIELRIGLVVGILTCIQIDSIASEQMRSWLCAKRLEPCGIVTCAAVQLPSDLTTCQLFRSSKRTFCFTEELRNKDICQSSLCTTAGSARVVAFCTYILIFGEDERVLNLQGSVCPTSNATDVPVRTYAIFCTITNQVSLDETVVDKAICTAVATNHAT